MLAGVFAAGPDALLLRQLCVNGRRLDRVALVLAAAA